MLSFHAKSGHSAAGLGLCADLLSPHLIWYNIRPLHGRSFPNLLLNLDCCVRTAAESLGDLPAVPSLGSACPRSQRSDPGFLKTRQSCARS